MSGKRLCLNALANVHKQTIEKRLMKSGITNSFSL